MISGPAEIQGFAAAREMVAAARGSDIDRRQSCLR